MIFLGLTPKRYAPLGGAANDADAQAFITAAGITDVTQQSAVNQLVLDLKGYSIWTKMLGLYPILGGSASSHAVNLKTPGTYNLTFALGVTHSSTGITGNGISGYANTSISTSLTGLNNGHLSYYSRTNNSATEVEMGALKSSPNSYTDLALRQAGGAYIRYNNGGGGTYATNTDSKGFYIGNRTASNVLKLFKNGSSIQSLTTLSSATTTNNIFILAVNNLGTAASYSIKECALASIGDGLTDTEATNFNTAVNTFQTTLGRNV